MDELEKRELGLANYRDYGRKDVLLEGYPDYSPLYDFEWADQVYDVPASELQSTYDQSKRETEQEKQANPALFYAKALLDHMESEWYGADFDEPRWIVQQIIQLLEEKK